MFNKAKKEKDTYGIVGLGRFGYALAMELATSGADLVALDRDEEKVRELRDYTENAYVVKSLSKKSHFPKRGYRTVMSRWSASGSRWTHPF